MLPPWHVPVPHSLPPCALVWQIFWHTPVALHVKPAAQGQGSQNCPVPFAMQLVVPSARTMEQVWSAGQAPSVRSWHGVTGMQTGICRLGFSAIGSFAQYVAEGQASKSPQQKGRQSGTLGCGPRLSPAQPSPGPQSDDDWHGAFSAPEPSGAQIDCGLAPVGATWQPSVVVPDAPPLPVPVLDAPPVPPLELAPPAPASQPFSASGPGTHGPIPQRSAYVSRCGGMSPSGMITLASPPTPDPPEPGPTAALPPRPPVLAALTAHEGAVASSMPTVRPASAPSSH